MAAMRTREKPFKFWTFSVKATLFFLILFLIVFFLYQRQIIVLPERISLAINTLLLFISTLFGITVLFKLTGNYVKRFFDEPEEQIFYKKMYSWTLYTLWVLFMLNHFGVSLANLTLVLGLMATGLAFAVRDVLLMVFAWMILLRKKPFRIGDYIKIGQEEGKVKHIGTFYVLLDKTHNMPEDYIRVPNRIFLEQSIINLGKNYFYEQIQFPLSGVPEEWQKKVQALKNSIPQVSGKNIHTNVFIDMRSEKLVLVVEYIVSFELRQPVRSEVIELIFDQLRGHVLSVNPT